MPLLRRIALVVFDIATAMLCLAAWVAPQALPPGLLRSLALVMLIEFLTIHATVMVPLLAVTTSGKRSLVLAMSVGVVVYAMFALGASLALDTWWPSLVLAWLLVSRYLLPPWSAEADTALVDPGKLWFVSLLLWLGLVFLTIVIPLPELGWDDDARRSLGLPGTGIWIKEPYRLLAFAALYFGLLAWFKFASSRTVAEFARPQAPSIAEQRREAREAGLRARAARELRLARSREKARDDTKG